MSLASSSPGFLAASWAWKRSFWSKGFDKTRIRAFLGKRRNFDRVGVDERRLDKALFHEFVEEGLHDVTGAVPALLKGDVMLFGEFNGVFK